MKHAETAAQLRIGELAAELGVNPKTIRYYESIGLLPAPQRSSAGYRLYGADDRERLYFIRKAKTVGLTLEEIRDILILRGDGKPLCDYVLRLIDRKLDRIDEQLRMLLDIR
jgi:MerR family transcriptional regulator, Zn(II)-responsive regulator of zntA